MKTIGLIGGLSWQSSLDYYRIINQQVAERLGGQHSAVCAMYSLDLDPILIYRDLDEWSKNTAIMVDAVRRVEAAGADFTLICSNTMHKTYEEIQAQVQKPILHILPKCWQKRFYVGDIVKWDFWVRDSHLMMNFTKNVLKKGMALKL